MASPAFSIIQFPNYSRNLDTCSIWIETFSPPHLGQTIVSPPFHIISVVLTFNTIIIYSRVKVKKNVRKISKGGEEVKIYSYEGKKNISGERIREARLKLRLTQADLAARVQVEGVIMERDSISRIEIGTRFIPDYEIPVFARVLGVSVLWLLGIE